MNMENARKALVVLAANNDLSNDIDQMMFDIAMFGLGVKKEMPIPSDYGLADLGDLREDEWWLDTEEDYE